MLDLIQYLGAFFGIGGALLLALHRSYSGYGWHCFLISNIFWIAYGVMTPAYGLLVQQSFFMGTSLLGIYRWRQLGKHHPVAELLE